MPALLSALRKELSAVGSADAGAARAIAVAVPTRVAVMMDFAFITGETLIDNSHIDNTLRSPFAHYACPMCPVFELRGSGNTIVGCAVVLIGVLTQLPRGPSRNGRKVCCGFLVRPAVP